MVLPSDIGGKNWLDDLAVDNQFLAANLNRQRPLGFVFRKPLTLLTVTVMPVEWLNGASFDTTLEADLVMVANSTNYIYLDGSFAPALQLKQNTTGFPAPTSGSFRYLAKVVTNSTEIVSITNLQIDRGGGMVGTVQSVTGAAPITSTGGANPVIGITAATNLLPGSMSAADKAKLDSITTPVPTTPDVVLRADYSSPGRILQGANPGPGPIGLALGTALQMLRVNSLATALEYFTASGMFDPQILLANMTGFHFDGGLGFCGFEFITQ